MSVFYIIAAVILGVSVIGGIFYISYLMESMKHRKAMIVSKSLDRAKKYQRFLDIFEEGVLPKDIKIILIEEILSNLRNIEKVSSDDAKTRRLLEEANKYHQDILKTPEKPPKVPKAKDMISAKEIQLQFKNLFKLLNYIGKTKKQHRKLINKNLKQLQSLYVETGASVHRNIAENAMAQSKAKLALYHLNQAMGEYARVDSKKFAGNIKELRAKISALEKQFQTTKAQPAAETKAAKPEKVDRGLDRMFDQEASMEAKRNMK